jgi:CBS domain-containing protein
MDARTSTRLTLHGATAADLMTPNLVSIQEDATVQEAVTLLTDKGLGAVPVVSEAGLPVGVLSRTDVVRHDRKKAQQAGPVPSPRAEERFRSTGETCPEGFQVVDVDQTQVGDIMTPAVFSVAPDAPAAKVVHEMVTLKIHRLFVVDQEGTLVGVVSVSDILEHLR